jgi:hypothetical protein
VSETSSDQQCAPPPKSHLQRSPTWTSGVTTSWLPRPCRHSPHPCRVLLSVAETNSFASSSDEYVASLSGWAWQD